MTSGPYRSRMPCRLASAMVVAGAVCVPPAAFAFPPNDDVRQAGPTRESLAASASAVKTRLSGAGRDSAAAAWRTNLAALVREVERIAATAKRPDKVELVDSDGNFRGAAVDLDRLSLAMWIRKHQGPADELHGMLAATFAGEIQWTGQLDSATVDPKTGDGHLELRLPRPETLPKGMTLADAATVVLPAAAVPAGGFPLAGARVSVTGILKDGPEEGVFVAYGLRPDPTKTRILVAIAAYSVEDALGTPVASPDQPSPAAVLPAVPKRSPPTRDGVLRNVLLRTVTPPGRGSVIGVTLSPDGRSAVTYRSGMIEDVSGMFLVSSGKADTKLAALEREGYGQVKYSPDGALAAVLSRRKGGHDCINIYRLPAWTLQKTLCEFARAFWWMPDGKRLLVSDRSNAFVESIETGESQGKFRIGGFTSAMSPDGQVMANEITEWGGVRTRFVEIVPVGRPEARLVFPAHKSWVKDLAFSSDAATLASASADSMVKLWSVTTGKLVRTLEGHKGDVVAVRFESDGKSLVTGSRDRTIRFWDVASGTEIGRLTIPGSEITCLDLSADQSTLAIGEESGNVLIFDYRKLKESAEVELKGNAPSAAPVTVGSSAAAQDIPATKKRAKTSYASDDGSATITLLRTSYAKTGATRRAPDNELFTLQALTMSNERQGDSDVLLLILEIKGAMSQIGRNCALAAPDGTQYPLVGFRSEFKPRRSPSPPVEMIVVPEGFGGPYLSPSSSGAWILAFRLPPPSSSLLTLNGLGGFSKITIDLK